MTASKSDIILDIQRIGFPITRTQYRQAGKFSDRQVDNHFGTFRKAVAAAQGDVELNTTRTDIQSRPAVSESIEIVGNTKHITLPKTHIDSLEKLIEHYNVDTSVWTVTRFECNTYEMGYKDNDGVADSLPLYQVKATFIRQPNIAAVKEELAKLKAEGKKSATKPFSYYQRTSGTGNMLEINIPDAHFGKMAWGKETGWENYDTTIAEQTYLRALETLVQRSKNYSFDQILFVVGNDLLNSDDLQGRTTKGTYVSTDLRYQKTFSVVRRTITKCIERLRQIAPVKVIMVSGNHDDLSVWHLGDSLECYFYDYKDVEVVNEPTPRKYHQHGKVMLMFTHGDKGKRTGYPLLMASEQSVMWGSTHFRECHTGHTHMTKTDEQNGVRVRVLPALCPPDAWHSENGFVGNQRNAEAYVWNDNEGLIGQVFYNDEAYPSIETKTTVV